MLVPRVPWLHAFLNWTSSLFIRRRASLSLAPMIRFQVPANFQTPHRRLIPAEARGKLIEFSARKVRKSA